MKRKTFMWFFLGIICSAFAASELYQYSASSSIDQYPYTVLKSYDSFEIRKYEQAYFNTVEINNKNYDSVSTKGFRILAGYIFGGNDQGRKIAMTSPVIMNMNEKVTMKFMVPFNENPEMLPEPTVNNIQLEKVSEKKVAAITFSGWASDKKIKHYAELLKRALDQKGLKYYNTYSYYGYNPPFQVFGRKNEVVIELLEY